MFGPKPHQCRAPLTGNARDAMDVARTTLLALGFEILSETETELCARGPGMNSSREPALVGASELELRVTPSHVDARATLGGVATMKAFLYLFPPGLALSLALVFALCGIGSWWICLFSVAPWLFFSPWIASAIERRTASAVDRLVRGMAGARARAS